MPIPNLQQRLYAQSGQATLADLPFLYGQLEAERAARAAAQGAGQGAQGNAKAQQLTALSGGGAPGDASGTPGGGFTGGMPAPDPISSPGRNGTVNALRDYTGGAGRSEGGGFTGGGNLQANSDRYADVARRGIADPTLSNIGKAIGFGVGLSGTSPLTIAAGEALKAMGIDTGLGLPEFTGYHSIPMINGRPPRNFQEMQQALHEAQVAQAREQLQGAAQTPGGLNYGDVGMGRRNVGAYGGAVGPFGGYGGGYGGEGGMARSGSYSGAGSGHNPPAGRSGGPVNAL